MFNFKKVVSQVGYQVIGKIVTSGLGLITTALLTRYLGTMRYGEYSLALSVALLAYLVADYGFETYLVRETAAHPGKQGLAIAQNALAARAAIGTTITLILLVGVWVLPYPHDVKLGILVAGLGNFVYLTTGVMWSVLQGKLAFGKIVIAQIGTAFLDALFIVLGMINGAPLLWFLIANTLSIACGCFLTYALGGTSLRALFRAPKQAADIMRTLKAGFPFALGLIVSVAYFKIDMLVLASFFPPNLGPEVGIYALAYKPFEVMIVFGGYFARTLYPLFSAQRHSSLRNATIMYYSIYALLSALGVGVFLYVAAPFIIVVLGSRAFSPSILVIRILASAASVTVLSGFFNAIALSARREKEVLYIAASACALNLILNLIYVPMFSYFATAWITVLTQSWMLILFMVVSMRPARAQKI